MNNNTISKIINSRVFLAVISLFIALFVWLFVNVAKATDMNGTINNVSFDFEVSRNGYEYFIDSDTYENLLGDDGKISGSVDVRGLRYIIQDNGMKDRMSIVNENVANNTGSVLLTLNAKITDDNQNFEIISTEPKIIYAYYDTAASREFNIELDDSQITTAEGYLYQSGDAVIDSGSIRLIVSGPETIVQKIEKVVAKPVFANAISQNEAIEAEYVFYDEDGNKIQDSELRYLKKGDSYITGKDFSRTVKVNVPIYEEKEITTGVEFTNKPTDYTSSDDFAYFDITFSPSKVRAAIDAGKSASASVLNVATVDFSKLSVGKNEFRVPASEVEKANKCVILDNVDEFIVVIEVNASAFSSKTLTGDFNVTDPSGRASSVTPLFDSVVITGPEDVISSIDTSMILFQADLSEVDSNFTGKITVPVSVIGNANYWVYGDYTAEITIS